MKNLFLIKTHELLIQIKWDLFQCDLEVKSFHMKSSWFFHFLVEFSSLVHGFLVVQPMTNKFECLNIFESHENWESST